MMMSLMSVSDFPPPSLYLWPSVPTPQKSVLGLVYLNTVDLTEV